MIAILSRTVNGITESGISIVAGCRCSRGDCFVHRINASPLPENLTQRDNKGKKTEI